MSEDPQENWPQAGDRLFRDDLPDWQHNAVTGPVFQHDDISPWYRYVQGYREAADRIVASLVGKEPRGMMDSLFYPVAYLYRHHFELVLKTIIRIGSRDTLATPPNGQHPSLRLESVNCIHRRAGTGHGCSRVVTTVLAKIRCKL